MQITVKKLVDRIASPWDQWFMGEDLPEYLGINCYSALGEHGFNSRPVYEWMCTDTVVGVHLIYFRDEFVAIRSQSGRKMGVEYKWASRDAYNQVKTFIQSLAEPEDSPIEVIDWDQVIDTDLTLEFSSEVLAKKVMYQGVECDVVKTFQGYDSNTWQKIVIRHLGVEKTVEVQECVIPVPLDKDVYSLK